VFDAATSYDLPGPITDLLLPLLFLASRANRFFYYGVGTSGNITLLSIQLLKVCVELFAVLFRRQEKALFI
jgi:hypothetical protein